MAPPVQKVVSQAVAPDDEGLEYDPYDEEEEEDFEDYEAFDPDLHDIPKVDAMFSSLMTGAEEKQAPAEESKKKRKHKKKSKEKAVVNKEVMPSSVRLYRFLYTGNEDGFYVAGAWNPAKSFSPEKVPCVAEMVVDVEQAKLLVEAIQFVKPKWPRVEPSLFALALAVKSTTSDTIRGLLYSAATGLISNSQEFFTFIQHLSALKSGTGAGWKRFVASWYKSIPPPKLAEMVTRSRSGCGWTHKDVLRLTHGIKLPENYIALRTVITYLLEDLPAAEKSGNVPEAAEVLAALRCGDQLRRCADPVSVLALIKDHPDLGLRHVAGGSQLGHLTPEILIILLERMPIEEILSNVHNLHNALLLVNADEAEDSENHSFAKREGAADVTAKLVEIIGKAERAPPLKAYITLCDYEQGGRRMANAKIPQHCKAKKAKLSNYQKASSSQWNLKKWEKVKKKGEILPPQKEVVATLKGLLARSLSLKADKIQGKYLVTLDLQDHMFKSYQNCRSKGDTIISDDLLKSLKITVVNRNFCFWNNHINPGYAAVLLALYFSSHVSDVTVAVFTEEGVQCVSLEKEDKSLMNMAEALDKLKTIPPGVASLSSSVEWALQEGHKYDVFVNVLRTAAVATRLPKARRAYGLNPHPVLVEYQEKAQMPNSGIVNISLGRLSRVRMDYNRKRILDIFGFDEHIPDLVNAFASEAQDKF